MTEQARQARLEYRRAWAKANRDKVKSYNERYWNKRAEQAAAQQAAPAAQEAQPEKQ